MPQVQGSMPSPIGTLQLTVDENGALTALDFLSADAVAADSAANASPRLQPLLNWLTDYFAGKCPPLAHIPLAPAGTAFQQAVWRLLLTIPYGTTTTYGALAKQLMRLEGRAALSAQTIGGAVGRNPIPILIPCHRVIGAHGNLTGYSCGMARKCFLLRLEGVSCEQLSLPKRRTPKKG